MKPGRKLKKFTESMYLDVYQFGSRGMRLEDIAYFFDMEPSVFWDYCQRDPIIYQNYKKGKMLANFKVSDALFIQATEKENVTAMMFWLKTQAHWKEVHEIRFSFLKDAFGCESMTDLTEEQFEILSFKAAQKLGLIKSGSSNPTKTIQE